MTLGAATAWERMPERLRKIFVWSLWFPTWIGLLAGLFDRSMYEGVVAFSVAHALLILGLNRFRVSAFPAQVRFGFLLWVAVGTYVSHMTALMYVPTVGLIGNLFFNYCLLARLVFLLPWNREEKFSRELVGRVFLSPPVGGRFRPVGPS